MLDFAKAVHEAIGIESPRTFIAVFALSGFLFFGVLGWIIDKGYRAKLKQQVDLMESNIPKNNAAGSPANRSVNFGDNARLASSPFTLGDHSPVTINPDSGWKHITNEQIALLAGYLHQVPGASVNITVPIGDNSRMELAKQLQTLLVAAQWRAPRESNNVGDTPPFHGDVEAALRSIKAQVLYMPSATDLYFPVTDARYESRLIPHCKLMVIPSVWGHPAGAGEDPADSLFVNHQVVISVF